MPKATRSTKRKVNKPAPVKLGSSLLRVNYFDGQLLSAADLRAEQEYLLARSRRHNRFLHGVGVICGLGVTIGNNEIHIEPGMAIDCAGNELCLPEPVTLAIPRNAVFTVILQYTESLIAPVPNVGEAAIAFSRIKEGVRVQVSNETKEVDPSCKTASGCGRGHGLSIATIKRQRGRWQISLQARHK